MFTYKSVLKTMAVINYNITIFYGKEGRRNLICTACVTVVIKISNNEHRINLHFISETQSQIASLHHHYSCLNND